MPAESVDGGESKLLASPGEGTGVTKVTCQRAEIYPKSAASEIYTVRAIGGEADLAVVEHWRALWLEVGTPASKLLVDLEECTLQFISSARTKLQY